MPSQNRPQYQTVEVRPEGSRRPSSLAPSSPNPGSPGKSVHWDKDSIVKAATRQLKPVEQWSLYYFESHARQCRACLNPLDVYQSGRHLCDTGYSLAQDVAEHVFRHDGVVYSCIKEDYKLVPVELPEGYCQTAQLLRAKERKHKKLGRPKAIISHDSTGVPQPETTYNDCARKEVIIEPGRTPRRHKTKHKNAVVVDDAGEQRQPAPAVQEQKERRGSSHYEDLKRRWKEIYLVEERYPDRERRSRRYSYYVDDC
ncbi:hypothetical protein Tdes44962_MAKER02722 [Teratosphaeria destructans]|uniref:Uncharacterized protein n=1 Tax=Teratosphaeria destructans TaxID=418781 RepID=A0A9W7SSH8_9PEZI|nr:hypothetical protein Tdes44962_MAKER02722 [Teratosphaeria destructans]